MIKVNGEIRQCANELKQIMAVPKEERDSEWKKIALQAKKGLEQALYRFVTNGCQDENIVQGGFRELQNYYDPESYELLDKKIRVLAEIAKKGPECDLKSVQGFEDILENKQDGMGVVSIID